MVGVSVSERRSTVVAPFSGLSRTRLVGSVGEAAIPTTVFPSLARVCQLVNDEASGVRSAVWGS